MRASGFPPILFLSYLYFTNFFGKTSIVSARSSTKQRIDACRGSYVLKRFFVVCRTAIVGKHTVVARSWRIYTSAADIHICKFTKKNRETRRVAIRNVISKRCFAVITFDVAVLPKNLVNMICAIRCAIVNSHSVFCFLISNNVLPKKLVKLFWRHSMMHGLPCSCSASL